MSWRRLLGVLSRSSTINYACQVLRTLDPGQQKIVLGMSTMQYTAESRPDLAMTSSIPLRQWPPSLQSLVVMKEGCPNKTGPFTRFIFLSRPDGHCVGFDLFRFEEFPRPLLELLLHPSTELISFGQNVDHVALKNSCLELSNLKINVDLEQIWRCLSNQQVVHYLFDEGPRQNSNMNLTKFPIKFDATAPLLPAITHNTCWTYAQIFRPG